MLISGEVDRHDSDVPDENNPTRSLDQSINLTQTKESGRNENEKVDDSEYLKKYVNWYVHYVDKEKRQYIQKNQELARQLKSEKETSESLEEEMVEKEKKVVELMGALKTEQEKAMKREKTMNERIEQLEGKRQKMNKLCVRCEEESVFQFQSLSFCSKVCLEEAAKSLNSVITASK